MESMKQPGMLCYNETAKRSQSNKVRAFYRKAAKELGEGFILKAHFNRGGIAVWGETYAKIFSRTPASLADGTAVSVNVPVVEAYDTSMGLLVRQWNGSNSGRNIYIDGPNSLERFVSLVKELASKPFVRF